MEDGLPIPLPLTEEPSGKILVRMPRGIHAELAKLAARQGVSLNLLINSMKAFEASPPGERTILIRTRNIQEHGGKGQVFLELGSPFDGLMQIPNDGLRSALK